MKAGGKISGKRIPICYVIDDLTPGAGTENQLRLLLQHLDRERFDPHLVLLRPTISAEDLASFQCPVVKLNGGSLFSLATWENVRTLARYLREHDIQILQLFFVDSRLLGTIVGRLTRVPRLVFCRREMGYWVNWKNRIMLRALARMSHFCLVNAGAIKAQVADVEQFPADRIKVIRNGADIGPELPRGVLQKKDLGLPDDAPLVGIVANVRPVKRHDLFLEMAEKMTSRDCRFLVVGAGPGIADFRAVVARSTVADRFHFHHTTRDVLEVMNLFDVAVLTSETEGLSNALVEYAFAGVPTVAFTVGGNPEVVAHGETGFLAELGDTSYLAERVDALLADKDLAQRMGEAARTRALAEFSVQRMVRETEAFYLSISAGI